MNRSRFIACILAIALSAVATQAIAATVVQSTAFTYQGQLNAGGTLPSGQTYQFTFTLYDAATDGNVVGAPIPQAILVGSGGLFTTELDFGQIFNGTQYWLDIKVGTLGSNEQELAARQPINAVPVAQYALSTPPATFAEFSHTYSGTSTVVPSGNAIPFPDIGPSSGNPIIPFNQAQFTVSTSGTYEVSFEVSTGDAGGDTLAVYVNGLPRTTIGQNTKTQIGKTLLALNAGDTISVVNAGVALLSLQANSSNAIDANLIIRLLH